MGKTTAVLPTQPGAAAGAVKDEGPASGEPLRAFEASPRTARPGSGISN